ncbi:hypothetical protein ACFQV2_04000 [Actinokineospora soli]|uniref:Uncharacterized protein n=1 Tax=Actinokineospora soli TaxID=1048753 RepID=A0ABW2TI66_9PSEU
MTFHHGDNIVQIGDHNTVNKGIAPLVDLRAAVDALRPHVPPADRPLYDDSADALRAGDDPSRESLRAIAGIAAMLGSVGAPVVEAVRSLNAVLRG